MPFLDRAIDAAERAGALGAFLSGSGPTICAIAMARRKKIASAMLRAVRLPDAQTIITRVDNKGVRILKPGVSNRQEIP